MSDTTQKTLEIVLKGRDDGASSLLDKIGRRTSTLAQQLRTGGDIGELTGVKKFGKNVGEFLGTSQAGEIKAGAEQLRSQALADYGETVRKVADAERMAIAVDKARAGAILERTAASASLNRELKQIDASERRGVNATGSPSKRAEIRETAAENREAAEKAYQAVVARTAEVEKLATATDEDRKRAIGEKTLAAQKYAEKLKEIAKAEADAQKANRSANALGRGIAIAGGTLAAINIAGGVAEAWDKANQKLEEGKITAGEWTGELAKGLPIIGGTVQKAETLLMVISGAAKALREANKEAAELNKKIDGQNADRKRVDDVVGGVTGLNDNEKQRINREANAKLKEIQDARKAGEASGVVNAGNDRDLALKKAEADVIRKREADLAKVEASEREARARHVADVEGRIEDSRKTVEEQKIQARIADLKAQGKDQEAAELQIHADADAKRRELDSQRKKLAGENGLTDTERIALGKSIEAQVNAVGEAEQRAVAAARAAATKESTDKAKEDAIDTAKKVKDLLDRQLEEQRQSSQTAIQTQLSTKSSLMDGRGQTSFFNQSKSTTNDLAKVTKDNAKATTDLTTAINELLKKLTGAGAVEL